MLLVRMFPASNLASTPRGSISGDRPQTRVSTLAKARRKCLFYHESAFLLFPRSKHQKCLSYRLKMSRLSKNEDKRVQDVFVKFSTLSRQNPLFDIGETPYETGVSPETHVSPSRFEL